MEETGSNPAILETQNVDYQHQFKIADFFPQPEVGDGFTHARDNQEKTKLVKEKRGLADQGVTLFREEAGRTKKPQIARSKTAVSRRNPAIPAK